MLKHNLNIQVKSSHNAICDSEQPFHLESDASHDVLHVVVGQGEGCGDAFGSSVGQRGHVATGAGDGLGIQHSLQRRSK